MKLPLVPFLVDWWERYPDGPGPRQEIACATCPACRWHETSSGLAGHCLFMHDETYNGSPVLPDDKPRQYCSHNPAQYPPEQSRPDEWAAGGTGEGWDGRD